MNRSGGPDRADVLRQFVYGNVSVEEWVAQRVALGAGNPGEPWTSFERARRLFRASKLPEAVRIWRQIALTDELESRQVLQAWQFLRQAGEQPPANRAKLALGVVAEVPVHGAHDLLTAYRDGSARYLNFAGGAVVWEDRSVTGIQSAIENWLAVGQAIAYAIGPWDEPNLPPLPTGHARVMVLTPSGPHFGQGPEATLFADPTAGAFLTAATSLMQLILSHASA
jgi:hypothetical protein